jgi:hypothetical protein
LRCLEDRVSRVEASLTLSYAQLDSAAKQVFRQLGVLVADFAMERALTIFGANG